MNIDLIAFAESQGLQYKILGDEVGITCPNAANHHGGFDAKPSFNINLDKLMGHCFACNFTLTGENLLKWLNGGELDDIRMKTLALKTKLWRMQKESDDELFIDIPDIFFPPGEPWDEDGFRGISLETYRNFGAVRVSRGRYQDRIAFPIVVNGKLVGIDARTLVGDEPKYLRNKNSSCKHDWLFPYDYVKEMKPKLLLLGEGIFHGLNPVDKGFPALAFFGANNFSDNKLRMILALGVEEVCYVRDNDKAGVRAEQEIGARIKEWLPFSSGYREHVEENIDLGDMNAEEIQKCIDLRSKPFIPPCLPDRKPKMLQKCNIRKCEYHDGGLCMNHYWSKG